MDDLSCVAQARLVSGLTIGDAAIATGMSPERYQATEQRPLQFTVGELRALCTELNSDGRTIMADWLNTFYGLGH